MTIGLQTALYLSSCIVVPFFYLSLRAFHAFHVDVAASMTPCLSIKSAPPCRRQAKIERVQIVPNHSQPGLPRSTGSASSVFGKAPNANEFITHMLYKDMY